MYPLMKSNVFWAYQICIRECTQSQDYLETKIVIDFFLLHVLHCRLIAFLSHLCLFTPRWTPIGKFIGTVLPSQNVPKSDLKSWTVGGSRVSVGPLVAPPVKTSARWRGGQFWWIINGSLRFFFFYNAPVTFWWRFPVISRVMISEYLTWMERVSQRHSRMRTKW